MKREDMPIIILVSGWAVSMICIIIGMTIESILEGMVNIINCGCP